MLDEKGLSELLNISLKRTREIMRSTDFPSEDICDVLLVSGDNLKKWLTYDRICDKYIELNYKSRTEAEKELIRDSFYKGLQVGINKQNDWEFNRKEAG